MNTDHKVNKVVLITGCSSGVGMHTAVQLAKQGYRVYATLRNLEKSKPLASLAAQENVELRVLKLDVQDEGSIKEAVAKIIEETGKIDVLVNNAGFGSIRTLEQALPSQFHEIMDVNFYGPARCIRAVLPYMREKKSGHIVSVSSVGGLVGQPLNEIYCAAKFALEGLVESMATYLEPFFNIKMTLIEPAGIKSEFVNRVLTDQQNVGSPLQEVYAPILNKYIETSKKRGAFENTAQTPAQVAEIITDCILNPTRKLRIQTSENAKAFTKEKIEVDPFGTLLQRRIQKEFLGIESN